MEEKSTRHEAWKKLHIVSHPEICGIGAGVANIIITFPINKFTFRQQLESATITKTWTTTSTVLRNHSHAMSYVYRGCTMPLAQKCIANSLMYGVYPRSREYLADNTLGITLPLRIDCLLASGAAAITEATICTPFERLQSIVQNPVYDKKFKSLKFSFQYFLNRNPNNLFNGFSVILARNWLSTFTYFTIRDSYKYHFGDCSINHAFFGMVSGVVCCTLTYSLNTLRVKMQADLNRISVLNAIKNTYKQNADVFHRGFYYGWRVACFRSGLSWAITNYVYEFISRNLDTR